MTSRERENVKIIIRGKNKDNIIAALVVTSHKDKKI